MVIRTRWFLQIALIGLLPCCVRGPVNAAEPAVPAIALLEVGWKRSAAAFEAARRQYYGLPATARGDLRVPYAMTLVAVQHHKAREAEEFIEAALALKPNNLHLRKARLWICIFNKKYETALAEMPAIAKDVAAVAKADQAMADQASEQARVLGELIAFLRGPAAKAFRDGEVTAVENDLRQLLPRETHEAFAAGQKSVDDKQREMAEELREAQVKAKSNSDARRVNEVAELQQLCKDCEQSSTQVQPFFENREVVLKAQLEELRRTNIKRYTIKTDKDGKRERVKEEGSNDREIGTVSFELNNLPNAAAAEMARLVALRDRSEKQIEQLQKQMTKAADVELAEDRHSAAVRTRMTALTTYCEFPLEAEREKLVASFNKK